VGRWEKPSLEQAFSTLCESTGQGLGKYAQPVRVAITGNGVSPEMFDTLAFLGRDETLGRINAFLQAHADELDASIG
jgi:glutamyl-tRNA synthetase